MGKTIGKAFNVLEALARSGGAARVSDLAHETGLSEPSTCRLLGALVDLGYATRDPASSRYSATLKLWEISQGLIGHSDDLQVIAQPVLAGLSEATGESSALGVFDDGYSVYVSKADGNRAIRAVATVGARLPASATGFGKAMLAWRPELLPQALLRVHRFTPHTLTSRRDIEHDLEQARARGYVITREELHEGVCALGAPIFDRSGTAVAGLALWGSRDAILGKRQAELARALTAAADRISAQLGHVKPASGRVTATAGVRRSRARKAAA